MSARRYDARVVAGPFDVHAHAADESAVDGLRDHHQNAAPQADENLLRGLRLVEIPVLHDVAPNRNRNGTRSEGDVATCPCADEAAEARARDPSDDGAQSLIVRALDLRHAYLLDGAGKDLDVGRWSTSSHYAAAGGLARRQARDDQYHRPSL